MSNDPWTHPDKEWRAVLRLARSYGWPAPEVTTNHRHWKVCCPGPQVPGVERPTCEFIAFSSDKGSERYAKQLRATDRSNFAYVAALRRREDLVAIADDLDSVLASLGAPSEELRDT